MSKIRMCIIDETSRVGPEGYATKLKEFELVGYKCPVQNCMYVITSDHSQVNYIIDHVRKEHLEEYKRMIDSGTIVFLEVWEECK